MRVTYVQGSLGLDALPVVPPAVLHTPEGARACALSTLRIPDWTSPVRRCVMRTDPGAQVHGPAPVSGLPPNNGWSARWSGTLTPRLSGIHHFTLAGAGSGRLYLDDKLVARFDRVDFGAVAYAAVMLETRPLRAAAGGVHATRSGSDAGHAHDGDDARYPLGAWMGGAG